MQNKRRIWLILITPLFRWDGFARWDGTWTSTKNFPLDFCFIIKLRTRARTCNRLLINAKPHNVLTVYCSYAFLFVSFVYLNFFFSSPNSYSFKVGSQTFSLYCSVVVVVVIDGNRGGYMNTHTHTHLASFYSRHQRQCVTAHTVSLGFTKGSAKMLWHPQRELSFMFSIDNNNNNIV